MWPHCISCPARVSDRFDFTWYAAWNEAYTYPQVTSWRADADGKPVVALSGEMVSLEVKDFARAKDVCVNDILVNGPPVWRVTISFWNETMVDLDGDEKPDAPKNVVFEIELAAASSESADERDWFVGATPSDDTYRDDYNKPEKCPARRKRVSRRRATVHSVGNAKDSLSFTFVSLGEPSDIPSQIWPNIERYVNEVRVCARRCFAASSSWLRACWVHGPMLVFVADLGRAKGLS